MITTPTVMILGAGASCPYGFPLGRDLRNQICRMGDAEQDDLQFNPDERRLFEKLRSTLSTSGHSSVDAFLETRQELVEIGKIAIAFQISRLEDESKLFPPTAPTDSWYESLANLVLPPTLRGLGWGDYSKNLSSLKIITFNYDRSLERYLTTVANNRLQSDLQSPRPEIDALIVHVHGSLGELSRRSYVPNATADDIRRSSRSILIVHEAPDESREFKTAKEALRAAQQILFFGFGYYEPNMKRLGFAPGPSCSYGASVWAQMVGRNSQEAANLATKYGYKERVLSMNAGAPISEALRTLLPA